MSLTDEQMAICRVSAHKRQQQKRDRLRQRQQLGVALAHQASEGSGPTAGAPSRYCN